MKKHNPFLKEEDILIEVTTLFAIIKVQFARSPGEGMKVAVEFSRKKYLCSAALACQFVPK